MLVIMRWSEKGPTMRVGLNRKEYDDMTYYRAFPNAPQEVIDALRSRDYPKSTAETVTELLLRGYDVDVNAITYLVNKGVVEVEKVGRGLSWTADAIDGAADYLEQYEQWTPRAASAKYHNYSLLADMLGENAARTESGLFVVKTILIGEPSMVEWRPATKAEIKRIKESSNITE